jgi:hypothetical protein
MFQLGKIIENYLFLCKYQMAFWVNGFFQKEEKEDQKL